MNTDTNLSDKPLSKLSEESIFRRTLYSAYKHNFAIACWKKPQQKTCHFVVDLGDKPSNTKQSIDELGQGFLVSPFLHTYGYYFIHADLHYQSGVDAIRSNDFGMPIAKESFFHTFNTQYQANIPYENLKVKNYDCQRDESMRKDTFLQLIQKGIQAIERERFEKVVLSRFRRVDLPKNFDAVSSFFRLCEYYPNAFISLVYLPNEGIWMGATPETLIHVDSKQIFRTISLAGTQVKSLFKYPSEATWTQKEIAEQALVSRYIINCFKKIRLREFKEKGPHTVVAGDLLHLCTSFSVDMKEVNFPELGSVMLELLHPTSAICGMPKPAALDFINIYEQYNRKFFTGYLGPVNIHDDTHLFVNLRCMQIAYAHAFLYAGAGITIDSSPEKEWQEIATKMDIVKKCF